MRKIGRLFVAAAMLATVPSVAWADAWWGNTQGAAVGATNRCNMDMPVHNVMVPCWINWGHRAGADY